MPPHPWSSPSTGFTGLTGHRPTMEDSHVLTLSFLTSSSSLVDLDCRRSEPLHLFGVLDGHGGEKCAEYCGRELPKMVKSGLASGLPAAAAVVTAHGSVEANWFRSTGTDDSGTTAVLALLESSTGRVLVSNVGDSRALIVRRTGKSSKAGRAVPLTVDHDGGNRNEAKRIKVAKGVIDEDGYVNRGLTETCVGVQTARSLGDFDVKYPTGDGDGVVFHSEAVISTPELRWATLDLDDVLVLGCDGMFEASEGSADWMARSVRKHVLDGKTAEEMSELLANEAVEMGSQDNCSCLVVMAGE